MDVSKMVLLAELKRELSVSGGIPLTHLNLWKKEPRASNYQLFDLFPFMRNFIVLSNLVYD